MYFPRLKGATTRSMNRLACNTQRKRDWHARCRIFYSLLSWVTWRISIKLAIFFRPRELSTCSRSSKCCQRISSTSPSPSRSTRRPPSPKLPRRSGFESPTCSATLSARWTSSSSRPWGRATAQSSWPTARWLMPETESTRSTCWRPSQVFLFPGLKRRKVSH